MTAGLSRTVGGRPFGDLAAEIQHRDGVGGVHHELHVVLDQQHRGAALGDGADRGRQAFGLVRRQARPPARRAAEAGAARRASGRFRAAAAGRRRARSPPSSAAPSSPTKSSSSRARASISRSACRVRRVRSSADSTPPLVWRWQPTWMFSSTERFWKSCTSWKVRTRPAAAIASGGRRGDVLAREDDAPGIRRLEAGNQVEQRGLARAVRADHRGDAAVGDLEIDGIDGDQPAEPPRHVLQRQQRHALPPRGMRLPSAASPFGA